MFLSLAPLLAFGVAVLGPRSAALNPYTGMQIREETFEFAQKPKVTKQGGKVVIAFASKGKCDVTVAIVRPDGKIVRHLASGVLGANAPQPFKQNSLSQAVEWDGKDDKGKPAPAGCKVRVSLGLKANYENTFLWDPRSINPNAMVADEKGMVYWLTGGTDLSVRVFDREGRYVRTVAPFPAHLLRRPEKVKGLPLIKLADGEIVPDQIAGGGSAAVGCMYGFAGLVRQTPCLMPDGRLIFSNDGYRLTKYFYSVSVDGSCPDRFRGPALAPRQRAAGTVHLAASPDGKWIYVGGLQHGRMPKKGSYHAVYRVAWNEKGPPAQAFLGEPGKPGDGEKHFNDPQGIAVDGEGHIFVADRGNNRIQIFKPDGSFLRSLKVQGPDQLQFDTAKGVLYALSFQDKIAHLVKLDPEDGKVQASFEVPGKMAWRPGGKVFHPVFCLAPGDPPILWVVVETHPFTLWRVADRGGQFEKVGDLKEDMKQDGVGYTVTGSGAGKNYLVVDRRNEELYLRHSSVCPCARVTRFDGKTGKILPDNTKMSIDELAFLPDGTRTARCYRGVTDPHKIIRLDSAGKRIPFPGGAQEIATRSKQTAWSFGQGLAAGPDGKIYAVVNHVKGGRGGPVVDIYTADGVPHKLGLLILPQGSAGIKVDRQGNIYVAASTLPKKSPLLDGLGAQAPQMVRSGRSGGLIRRHTPDGKLIWEYAGLLPVSRSRGCICGTSRFDVDDFGRAFVPQAYRYSVMVLDANGNKVLRIGRYGNADSRGPDSAVLDPQTGFLRPRRPDDPKDLKSPVAEPEIAFGWAAFTAASDAALYTLDTTNKRVLKIRLGYRAEEVISLP